MKRRVTAAPGFLHPIPEPLNDQSASITVIRIRGGMMISPSSVYSSVASGNSSHIARNCSSVNSGAVNVAGRKSSRSMAVMVAMSATSISLYCRGLGPRALPQQVQKRLRHAVEALLLAMDDA